MKNIEVVILNQAHQAPVNMTMFLATLTQRGHKIKTGQDILDRYNECMNKEFKTSKRVLALPHGTINRFAPVTIAIVGASRRFLAQMRTHHIGIEWVSASLQYSDYSGSADFVVPYEYTERDVKEGTTKHTDRYLSKCKDDLAFYEEEVENGFDNDTAGYSMNQGLRNILIATASRDAWMNVITVRSCKRNTSETAYVTTLIWEALLASNQGELLYEFAGPDCLHGTCKEGFMCCGKPAKKHQLKLIDSNLAKAYKKDMWPLLCEDNK